MNYPLILYERILVTFIYLLIRDTTVLSIHLHYYKIPMNNGGGIPTAFSVKNVSFLTFYFRNVKMRHTSVILQEGCL